MEASSWLSFCLSRGRGKLDHIMSYRMFVSSLGLSPLAVCPAHSCWAIRPQLVHLFLARQVSCFVTLAAFQPRIL